MKRTYGTAYLLLALLVSCAPSNTKISKFCTPAGVCFSVSKMSVLMDQNTRKKTFEVNVVKPESLSQSAESALSDIAFEGIAGPGAEQTGADDAIVDVFPPTSGFFSVHSGYRGHYIKEDTGRWTREDGEEPPSLRELDRVGSPEGKSLVLTSRAVRDGELFLVFFCENCAGVDAIKQAAGALYDVGSLQGSAGMSVRQFHATVFAGQRHTGWDFPPVIFVEGKRDDANQWVLPKLTRAQFVSLVEAKLRRR